MTVLTIIGKSHSKIVKTGPDHHVEIIFLGEVNIEVCADVQLECVNLSVGL
jgi:hypothetical protein